ncbi:MarR family winged helix-turn-helix transcriptional regulator [Duganella sp. BuS-21]|uniref:MarR family winged helix-turn-helix transcriptional regulator n=1 Tax=Duganella sp. BuS-21 TaxID=2943848 RepID=UPI0035A7176D
MTSIEERFSTALHGSARVWRLAIDRRLKHLNLSQASWMAIALTAKEAEPPSQTRLAARAGVEDPTMVATVDRLVKAGYMVRTPSATDRRVKLLSLTPAGQEIYESVRAEAEALRRELLGTVDPDMLRTVTAFLEAIQANIESLP